MTLGMSGRAAVWLALAALLLNTMWSFSASAKPPGIPQEICSADASKYSNKKDHDPGNGPPSEHRLAHCALCLPGAHGALATPPGFHWLTHLSKAPAGRLRVEPELSQRVFLHPHAQPRAPPLFA
jgi:hypothetical protein